MPLDRRDALAVLRLPPSADAATIKRTYRQLVRDLHPDVGGDVAAFQELQLAYEALLDHTPTTRPGVRRGQPSRHHVAWSTARDGRRPETALEAVDWDGPMLEQPAPLDPTGLAVRLAAVDDGGLVVPTTATSRAPGSRLNRVAASLSPDLTASLSVAPVRDDRGIPVIATTVTAGSRKARRALDAVPLAGGWMRTRRSAATTVHATITPDADPRRTALRVVEPLDELLEQLSWPLSTWVLTDLAPA